MIFVSQSFKQSHTAELLYLLLNRTDQPVNGMIEGPQMINSITSVST